MEHTNSGVLHWTDYFNIYGMVFRIHIRRKKQIQRLMYFMLPFMKRRRERGEKRREKDKSEAENTEIDYLQGMMRK